MIPGLKWQKRRTTRWRLECCPQLTLLRRGHCFVERGRGRAAPKGLLELWGTGQHSIRPRCLVPDLPEQLARFTLPSVPRQLPKGTFDLCKRGGQALGWLVHQTGPSYPPQMDDPSASRHPKQPLPSLEHTKVLPRTSPLASQLVGRMKKSPRHALEKSCGFD